MLSLYYLIFFKGAAAQCNIKIIIIKKYIYPRGRKGRMNTTTKEDLRVIKVK